MAAALGLTPDQAGAIAYTDLVMLAATLERHRRNEMIRQDARFIGLISALFKVVGGGKFEAETYFESLRDESKPGGGGAIRDPDQMRSVLMAWCAASGGKIVGRKDEG